MFLELFTVNIPGFCLLFSRYALLFIFCSVSVFFDYFYKTGCAKGKAIV